MNKSFDVVRCSNCVSLFGPQSVISDLRVRFADWAKFLGMDISIDKGYLIAATTNK